MTRTILIHLHVEASDADTRDADEIADAIGAALEPTDETYELLKGLTFSVPLVDELHARP